MLETEPVFIFKSCYTITKTLYEECNQNSKSRAALTSSVIDVTKFNSLGGRRSGETYIKLRLKAHITCDVTLPHLESGATKVRSTF